MTLAFLYHPLCSELVALQCGKGMLAMPSVGFGLGPAECNVAQIGAGLGGTGKIRIECVGNKNLPVG